MKTEQRVAENGVAAFAASPTLVPLSPPLRLPPKPSSAEHARRYVEAVVLLLGAVSVLDSALLAVSELVTNAVVHARTPVELAIYRTPQSAIRLEVADFSSDLPKRRPSLPDADDGRGLFVVEGVSTAWGVELAPATGPGKVVWCELLVEA